MTLQDPDIRPPIQDALHQAAADIQNATPFDVSLFEGTTVAQLSNCFSLEPEETALVCILAARAFSTERHEIAQPLTIATAIKMFPSLGWSTFAPSAVLRDWALVHVSGGQNLLDSSIALDSHVLNWLLGFPGFDPRLKPYVANPASAHTLPAQFDDVVSACAAHIRHATPQQIAPQSVIVGDGPAVRMRAAELVAAHVGMQPLALDPVVLDLNPVERCQLFQLIARETVLAQRMPVMALDTIRSQDLQRLHALKVPTLILSDQPPSDTTMASRVFALPKLSAEARADLWCQHLQPSDPTDVDELAESFDVSADEIEAFAHRAQSAAPEHKIQDVWASTRNSLRPNSTPLAQVNSPKSNWDDLILPAQTEDKLKAFAGQVRNRAKVYRSWGFGRRLSRGLGITALFAGPSGTGKTLAADAVAQDLGLDLMHVNVSQVVDKYIGETEKHIGRMFDAAERSGAILFFDEADALFGQRGDGDNAQDRFASMTVAYLLQRIETSQAICILATNLLSVIDDAFMRRMRYVIHFAFPSTTERKRLWETAFPESAPLAVPDLGVLAQLPVSGGTIRNAALNAAFVAADQNDAIKMDHILFALEAENAKLAQPMDLSPLRRRVTL